MTAAARQFVTPALSRRAHRPTISSQSFSIARMKNDVGHIRLSREADLIVVAPSDRRPDGQARQWPRQRPRLYRAARHRQEGADGAGDEPKECGRIRRRAATAPRSKRRRPLRGPRKAARWPKAARPARAAWPSRWRSLAAIEALARHASAPNRLPAKRSSSPPGRRMSRSIRCATSPTARPASGAMRIAAAARQSSAPTCALVSGPVDDPRSGGREDRPCRARRGDARRRRTELLPADAADLRRRRRRLAQRRMPPTRRSRR